MAGRLVERCGSPWLAAIRRYVWPVVKTFPDNTEALLELKEKKIQLCLWLAGFPSLPPGGKSICLATLDISATYAPISLQDLLLPRNDALG
jgi:hypothetical protein